MKTKSVVFDLGLLEDFRKEKKLQPFRVKQILHEVFQNQQVVFAEMTTLSKSLREDLEERFNVISLDCETTLEDLETTKFGFKTRDGYMTETVLMYHWNKQEDNEKKLNRITICVSCQIGCPVGCSFCVTGKLWIVRNLRWDEIVSQILYANNFIKKKFGKKEDWTWNKIRNVVYMWMGEPLLNYENVVKSLDFLLDQNKFSLSRRHITISTCGIISGIEKLIEDNISVKLAVSLHAPNQKLREELIPMANTNKLSDLMKVLDKYIEATNNRIFYEYIMIRGITDGFELAEELAKLLRWQLAHLNLIPYNENPAIDYYQESDIKQIREFKKKLENRGVTVTIRDSLWRDVKSACGQLGYDEVAK